MFVFSLKVASVAVISGLLWWFGHKFGTNALMGVCTALVLWEVKFGTRVAIED
jgi:hypothetical protein